MPYPIERPTWSRGLDPILRAFDGFDNEATKIEDLFDDDEDQTQWRDDEQGFLGGDEQDLPNRPSTGDIAKIVMPQRVRQADRQADQIAVQRGVDISRRTEGTGGVIDAARAMLGVDYLWGAEGPNGTDCSGLVYWAFTSAGIDIPRVTAREYQNVFKYVPSDEIQAGDVLYFSYGRLGRGVVDHIGIAVGGGMMIDASSSQDKVVHRAIDTDNLISGGRLPGAGGGGEGASIPAKDGGKRSKPKVVSKPILNETSTVPAALAGGEADFTSVLGAVMAPDATRQFLRMNRGGADAQNIPGGVKGQIAAGFRSMGREDLAKMVNTKAFQVWIQQESGWRVDVTSPANNHGLANDGLFQVWRGHDYNSNGQVAKMSAYEQARLIAKYFSHLTPAKIRQYAREISAGTYHGWG